MRCSPCRVWRSKPRRIDRGGSQAAERGLPAGRGGGQADDERQIPARAGLA